MQHRRTSKGPRVSKNTRVCSLEDSQLSSDSQPSKIKLRSKTARAIRILCLLGGGVLLAFTLSVAALAVFLDKKLIIEKAASIFATQTGSRLEVGDLKLSLFGAVTLNEIRLFSPTDATAMAHSNEPFFTADEFRLRIGLRDLFFLNLSLREAVIIAPSLNLQMGGPIDPIQNIIAYRAETFPSPEASEQPLPDALDLSELIPHLLVGLSIPIGIELREVGLQRASMKASLYNDQGDLMQEVSLDGVDVSVNLRWKWGRGQWQLVLGNQDGHIPVKISNNDANLPFKKAQLNLVSVIDVSIHDLSEASVQLDLRPTEIQIDQHRIKDLSFKANAEASWGLDLSSIDITSFELSLGEIISTSHKGLLRFIEASPIKPWIDLEGSLEVNFEALSDLLQPIAGGFLSSGRIFSERLFIRGPLYGSELLAELGVGISFDSVSLGYDDAVSIQNLSGFLGGSIRNGIRSAKSQLDLEVDLNVTNVSVSLVDLVNQDLRISLDNIVIKNEARLNYPELDLPLQKLSIGIEKTSIEGTDVNVLVNEVSLHSNASFASKFDSGQFSLDLSLPKYGHWSLQASCSDGCQLASLNSQADLPDLNEMFSELRPLLAEIVDIDYLPSALGGSVSKNIRINAFPIPDNMSELLPAIAGSKVSVQTDVGVSNLKLELPYSSIKVNVPRIDVASRMDTFIQQLNIALDLKDVSLAPEVLWPDITNVRVSDVMTKFDITNKIDITKIISPLDALKEAKSKLNLDVAIGKLATKGDYPLMLAGNSLKVAASHDNLKQVTLSEFATTIPAAGLEAIITAHAALAGDLVPSSFELDSNFSLDAAKVNDFSIPGIFLQGSLKSGISLRSEDFRNFLVEGGLNLHDFSLIARDEPSDSLVGGPKLPAKMPSFSLEGAHGSMPIRQLVNYDLGSLIRKHISLPVMQDALQISHRSATIAQAEKTDVRAARYTVDSSQFPISDSHYAAEFSKLAEQYFARTKDPFGDEAQRIIMLDYGGVRGFYPDVSPIGVKRVTYDDFSLENIELDIAIRQNWLSVNHFVLDFLDGKIAGDLQIAIDPGPRFIQVTIHFNDINPKRLLDNATQIPRRTRAMLAEDAMLAGVVSLKYDLQTGAIGGGLEMSSIGREQLRMLLFYLDPDGQNDNITNVRRALVVGDVRHVSVPIRDGLIDMEIDVRFLGAPVPTPRLRRFPIGQVVDNFARQYQSPSVEALEQEE